MSRIIAIVAIAVLLVSTPLVADLALQNDSNIANNNTLADQQTEFTETAAQFVGLAPPAFLVLVIGLVLAGVRGIGSGGMR
jgi:hypothetical protein